MSRFWVSKNKRIIINVDHIAMIDRQPPRATMVYLSRTTMHLLYLDEVDTQSLLDLIATDKR